MKSRHALCALLFLLVAGTVVAQNNTNSPYTRYGYGKLEDPTPANSKAMGGVAYAMRDKYCVNFANPASYTAVDSLTFIFDGGITLQNTNFSDGKVKKNAKNSSFDYITMEFRAAPWMGISLGMIPYSNVGYSLGQTVDESEGVPAHAVSYYGEGGLHQLYLGAGIKILKNLSVGANISYLWGDIERGMQESFSSSSLFYGYTKYTNLDVRSYKLDLGAQYSMRLGKKHALTLGAVLSPGHNLNNDASVFDQLGNEDYGYTTSTRDTVLTCGIPTTWGVGATYIYDQRLTVALDAGMQHWNDVTYMNEKGALCKRGKVSLGAEYLPNPLSRSYLGAVKYRIGAYYSKPYYKIDGARAANEFGITAGFGLPLVRSRSVLNLSAQYVRLDGKKNNFLDENTFRICVGITFNERWFFKRKVD